MFHEKGLDEIIIGDPKFVLDRSENGSEIQKYIGIAKGSLILDQPFFGYLLGHFQITPTQDKRLTSFAIDNNYLYFNTQFVQEQVNGLKNWKSKIKGILLHLVLHLIHQHHLRQKDRDPIIWGHAADLVIVQVLDHLHESKEIVTNLEFPSITSVPIEYRGLTTEQIYNLLAARVDDTTDPNNSKTEENQLKELTQINSILFDKCDLDQILVMENELSSTTQELTEQLFRGVLRSAYEWSMDRGELPGNLSIVIKDLLVPKIQWKEELTHFLQKTILHDLSWTQPNKRLLSQGIYLPSNQKENIVILLAVDTSGSIHESELRQFLTEAQAILETIRNVRLIIVDCDADIQQVTTYEHGESVRRHKFKGQGGTDLRPAFDLVDQYDVDLLVYFTDGQGPIPDRAPIIPVIWILTTAETPNFGKIIRYYQ
ncbi:MAG: vWA domain-containing protein [Candidatus Kariarchaeaceae archaeon]